MSEVNEVNNTPKGCPEPDCDLTMCNKVHVHTNASILKLPQEIDNEII